MSNLADTTRVRSLLVLRRAARKAVGKGRRLRRPPRILYPTGVERTYTKTLINIVAHATAVIESRVVPALPSLLKSAQAQRPTPDTVKGDAYGDAIANLLELVRSDFFGHWGEDKIAAMVRKVAKAVSEKNGEEITRVFSDVLGVDLFNAEPWLNAEVGAFVTSNVALITTINRNLFDRVEAMVYDGARSGLRWQEVADQLRQGPYRASRSRAELIARDQIGKFNGQLAKLRQTGAGLDEYIWRTSHDARVRDDHAALDGKTFAWSSPPVVDKRTGRRGHPGEDFQCFPGSTAVGGIQDVTRLFRRRFPGPLAFVVTESGTRIEATPNHPMLTLAGWQALHTLNVGDYLIKASDKRPSILEIDPKQTHLTIGDLFGLAGIVGDVLPAGGHATQFHGDGSAKEIEVVTLKRGLAFKGDPALIQRAGERLLAVAYEVIGGLSAATQGELREVSVAFGISPNGRVSRLGQLLALFGREATHTDYIRRRAAADFYARALKAAPDHPPIDAMLSGEAELTCSGDILGNNFVVGQIFAIVSRSLDLSPCIGAPPAELMAQRVRVAAEALGDFGYPQAGVEKRERIVDKGICKNAFDRHVFNLETSKGWYVAEGYLAHNCRCYAEPVLAPALDAEPEDDDS